MMAGPASPQGSGGDPGSNARRRAPAAGRNVGPIGDVLEGWLPRSGLLLEIASGTGEHALAFSRRFPGLSWQPTDADPDALASIAAWREEGPGNLRAPVALDVRAKAWPIGEADAILSINMVHIAPWQASLGLLDGAARLLARGAPLILYGPWIEQDVTTAPSNQAFDISLRDRDPDWGLRRVDEFAAEAASRGLVLADRVAMPANNIMLRFEAARVEAPGGGDRA